MMYAVMVLGGYCRGTVLLLMLLKVLMVVMLLLLLLLVVLLMLLLLMLMVVVVMVEVRGRGRMVGERVRVGREGLRHVVRHVVRQGADVGQVRAAG